MRSRATAPKSEREKEEEIDAPVARKYIYSRARAREGRCFQLYPSLSLALSLPARAYMHMHYKSSRATTGSISLSISRSPPPSYISTGPRRGIIRHYPPSENCFSEALQGPLSLSLSVSSLLLRRHYGVDVLCVCARALRPRRSEGKINSCGNLNAPALARAYMNVNATRRMV